MGWKKKALVFLLPIILYYIFKFVRSHFLIFVVVGSQILPRLPFECYKELNPDIKDFAESDGELLDEYDFVIIGAGSAGAVVANRLSENESWKILLVEAGGEENTLSEIPGLLLPASTSHMNWGYMTEPNKDNITSTNHINGRVLWPKGKVIGGTSVINGMIYARGNKKDYDSWEQQGNPGWGFESVLSYFKKSEDNRDKDISMDKQYHSTGGSLTVESPKGYPNVIMKTMDACKKILPDNPDYNGNKQTGCFHPQLTRRDGRRCSTAKAFLKPKRKNLYISPHSHVHKIIIDSVTKKASGIIYKKSGVMKRESHCNERDYLGCRSYWLASGMRLCFLFVFHILKF